MSVSRGKRIGPYEVLGLIGAGGMGEVYQARDPRLGRDVAIKVLPAAVRHDPERLRRFEQEARAAGALNHPNVLVVFDVGTDGEAPFIVSEFLEGNSLRHLIGERPLPVARALDYAVQIARGLAAAHQKGILHRDLKPENLFVTRDGHVKILDFGLAKLKMDEALPEDGSAGGETWSATKPGTLLGTVGYMAPEQVSGGRTDQRADLFSFGAVLYEMLTGRRAFKGPTAVETMAAILREDPPPISSLNPAVPPGLERLAAHCLEKHPEARCESARDLAFQLEGLSHPSGTGPVPLFRTPRLRQGALAGLALLLLAAGAMLARGWPQAGGAIPEFRQLTFRRGEVLSARFSPDGHTILYTGSWDGGLPEVFSKRIDSTEARSLGWPDTELLSVTHGTMAILKGRNPQRVGTLLRANLDGSDTPRQILTDVRDAGWSPRGDLLAVVRRGPKGWRLELPADTVLHEASGPILSPRISPDGDRVAFIERAVPFDTRGSVVVADRKGGKRVLSEWKSVAGLAWSADGRALWFTATKAGTAHALYKATLDGREQVIARVAGTMQLEDISADGKVLFSHSHGRIEARGLAAGDTRERDLSYMDTTNLADLSADGRKLLFTDSGEGGGPLYSVYLRGLDDGSVVRLGDGAAHALSPARDWAVAALPTSLATLTLLPTGAGRPLALPRGTLTDYQGVWWLPDGKRLLILADQPGRPTRLYVQDVPNGQPRPVGPVETSVSSTSQPVAPDGRFLASCALPAAGLCLYRTEPGVGEAEPVIGLEVGDEPLSWSGDGRFVFVRSRLPAGRVAHIHRIDRRTGERVFQRELRVADPAGAKGIFRILLTPDGRYYAYQFYRSLDVLYLAEGLR